MDAVVQKQITDQFATVTSLVEQRAAPAVLAPAYGRLGSLLFAANRANAAETCYLHAQALAPREMRWPYYLGHVYMNRPDRPKAIAAFERALQLRPGDAAALVWLGTVYLDDGQPAQADTRFTQALASQPRMAAALYGLGPGGAGPARVRAGGRAVRAGARGRSARVDHALSARARVPGARRHREGGGAPAPAGHGADWPARIR